MNLKDKICLGLPCGLQEGQIEDQISYQIWRQVEAKVFKPNLGDQRLHLP